MGKPYTRELRIQLAAERGIIVDDQDMWLLEEYTWAIDNHGYAFSTNGRKTMKLHHFIMGQPIWEKETIDHVNGNKRDNRRSNLRYATYHENQANRRDVSNAKYVYPIYKGGYVFRISRQSLKHVEYYKTQAEAIAARDKWMAMQESERC